ncbi:MAG: response regulator receiver [Proteobacteria bacterium]|nr:response regulator receiver [Pseudomonadota bacterium]
MSDFFRVFVVDDDAATLEMIRTVLESEYGVETFDSVEACLPRLEQNKPDLFLLDVSLPGMDGYTFCRQIKDDFALNRIPVTFVSSHESSEARLKGYEAGGEDFVVKPFNPEELRRKVRVAEQIARSRKNLEEQIESAEYLSTLALAGMDEGGIALQFMSELIAWESEQEVAEGLLRLMQRYRLDGAVQTRIGGNKMTRSAAGINLPLESSVLDHVSKMDRIFEFKNRAVHNFERVSLMVNNLPLNDPDYCGRLRDNLSIAVQGADSRLRAIEIEMANRRSQEVVLNAMASIRDSITDLQHSHEQDKNLRSLLIFDFEKGLMDSFVHLGLTEKQEAFLMDFVNNFMQRLVSQFDRSQETFGALNGLSEQLRQLLP